MIACVIIISDKPVDARLPTGGQLGSIHVD
jgi:hypothetical protein